MPAINIIRNDVHFIQLINNNYSIRFANVYKSVHARKIYMK